MDYLPWTQPLTYDERPCLRDASRALTYGQVRVEVEAVAAQLKERGLGRGDVVAVMLPNRVELLIVLWAAWRLGATATPVNPALTVAEASYQIDDSGAVLVVGGGALSFPGVATLAVDLLHREPSGPAPAIRQSPDDIALIVYTSGSTGRPKGVLLDHNRLEFMAASMAAHTGLGATAGVVEHCLLVLPLFHVNAICVSWLAAMLVGGQLTVLSRFSPADFLAAIAEHRPTYFSAVPTIYTSLVELPAEVVPDVSSLRFAICGAAPASREVLAATEKRFGIAVIEGYGLTEGTCASTCNPVNGVRKVGTVGPALPGQRIAIAGPDGRHLPPGGEGEVLIHGPNVMIGYLGREAETAATIVDGWLRTGDVGRLDEDGYLTLVDRIKDMIIRGGENLYPKEIEQSLQSHPAVLEAAVIGRPDPRLGEVPVAYVVTWPGTSVTPEELLAHCRLDLTKVKLPVAISIVDALPKNPVGKLDKPALRRALLPV